MVCGHWLRVGELILEAGTFAVPLSAIVWHTVPIILLFPKRGKNILYFPPWLLYVQFMVGKQHRYIVVGCPVFELFTTSIEEVYHFLFSSPLRNQHTSSKRKYTGKRRANTYQALDTDSTSPTPTTPRYIS